MVEIMIICLLWGPGTSPKIRLLMRNAEFWNKIARIQVKAPESPARAAQATLLEIPSLRQQRVQNGSWSRPLLHLSQSVLARLLWCCCGCCCSVVARSGVMVTQLGEKISPLSSAASRNDEIIILICGMEGREKWQNLTPVYLCKLHAAVPLFYHPGVDLSLVLC